MPNVAWPALLKNILAWLQNFALFETHAYCIQDCRKSMVQDSITDHTDTVRENSLHWNSTYRMTIILQRFFLGMLPTKGFKG